MRWGVLLAVVAVVGTGCQEPKHVVERVEVLGATVNDNTLLGLNSGQVQQLLVQRLQSNARFRLLRPGQKVPDEGAVLRMTLELAFTREEQKDAQGGTWAQVGAALALRRRTNDGVNRYDVTGLGEAKLTGESLDERQDAIRRALGLALDQAVGSARFQLDAIDKSDRDLVKDLASKDLRVHEFAVRTLAERKNPAALPELLEKLNDPDLDEVRRAMGALVEMHDVRAVPPLIELSRSKDLGFLKELIYALGALGGEEAQAYLYTLAQGHDQAAIREAARQALDELSQHARAAPSSISPSAHAQNAPAERGQGAMSP